MRRTVNGCWLAVVVVALPGCIVTVVGEYESYTGVVTRNYPASPEGATRAYTVGSQSTTFKFGASQITFQPPLRSDNVQAVGPLIPIIPVPGKWKDFGEDPFYIGIGINPGLESFLILNPAEFLITVEGSAKPLSPIQMKDCESNEVELSQLRLYGSHQCRRLYYDIAIDEVTRFTFTPATIEADEVLYLFPDIKYRPDTHQYVY